ncbi:Zinc transporter ZupT [bacterium HR26]|nr:Zinc transporter ZupT [bacterium HR26]
MSETTLSDGTLPRSTRAWTMRRIVLGVLPLGLLGAVMVAIFATGGGLGDRSAPPVEKLSIQRVHLPEPNVIVLEVVNDGPQPVTIAQVLVDDAYWSFQIAPDPTLDRLQAATITIPYPWVAGEAHVISLISTTGATFEAEVPVAVQSPALDRGTVLRFAAIGFYVGVVPVTLGLLWYPFLRGLGRQGLRFILALTAGLLLFLIVDMVGEAQEVAEAVPGALSGSLLVPLVALLSFLFLLAVSSRNPEAPQRGLGIAYRMALGIGLHNLGEGLAIGAAIALGEIALGIFLIVGFTLHNVTEGVGIAAPILRTRPALRHFAGLALLAGAPAILGVWIGGFVYSPLWATVFLAIGAGAIAQVVVEVARLLADGQRSRGALLDWTTLGGVTAGMALMYVTSLAVAA